MLNAPFTELPYKPTVNSFLAGIDTEYKDDKFRCDLLKLDPNNQKDRVNIIRRFIIKDLEYLTYRHKFILIEKLRTALGDKAFDFASYFDYDYEANEPSSSPWSSTEIHTPRSFFEDIFEVVSDAWGADLSKAASEDPATW